MTMELIAHQELTSSASSITFSSIPQTYTDLYLVVSARLSNTEYGYEIIIAPNGSTANGSSRVLRGYNGSSVQSYTESYVFAQAQNLGNGATSNTFGNAAVYISNYTSSNNKTFSADAVSENNASDGRMEIVSSLWSNTAAITSLQLVQRFSFQFLAGSSATLYGIRRFNTTLSPKATGGAISYDSVNNKWVHAFYTSGTFTPTENLSGVEYLVVAGGGGGGAHDTGLISQTAGGGAGGYRSSVVGESSGGGASAESTLSLTASTNYTVTIGAGGAGGSGTSRGATGSNSVFGSITANGGGGGGGAYTGGQQAGSSGGSGGGSVGAGGTIAGGSATANQGYAGGPGRTDETTYRSTGGGGGAGSVGQDVGNVEKAGNGGSGVASSITGTSVARAGGGGGGTPNFNGTASAGGGAGNNTGAGGSGTLNTGGGGGGGRSGGAGGSGIVIVRYSA